MFGALSFDPGNISYIRVRFKANNRNLSSLTLNKIAFIDTEIDPKSGRILDIGCITNDENTFHSPSVARFTDFLKGAEFICGHNIFNHDLK